MGKLDGKTVIITGAAGGIGSATTLRCLQDGAIVLGCDQDRSALDKLKELARNENLSTFQVNVSSYSEVDALYKRIKKDFPETDCLVNNAGIYLGQNILEYTVEQIEKVISVNVKGAIYFSKLFGEFLLGQEGHGAIVNISSVSGHEGSSDAIYGLSKSALFGLTKSCAMNFAPQIRVNAVAPGLVETDMIKTIPEWRVQEYRKSELLKSPIPLMMLPIQ